MTCRIGLGYDVHPLVEGRPFILGGVRIPFERGAEGHSDADALIHAICDAILGALGMGDIGRLFPPGDPEYRGIDSMILLNRVIELMRIACFHVVNIDTVVILERPKIAPFVPAMVARLAPAVGVSSDCMSIKATTTERLGFEGRGEGVAAQAIALLEHDPIVREIPLRKLESDE
jgi:2-C-methyl-D-erythritol 2,4-cyclodiphosphate synthase